MKVTHKINIHLDDKYRQPPIDVMQGDANTRLLEFTLYSGGEAWLVPEGVSVTVAYCCASGQGAYDTLQDDATKAYSVSGNVVTVTLIPQVAAVAGNTTVSVVFTDTAGNQLATFGVIIRVERNPAIGSGKPEFYYNLREWIGAGALDVHISSSGTTADKTFDEIVAAHNAGRPVRCHLQAYVLPLHVVTSYGVVFQSIVEQNYVRIAIRADNTITYSTGTYAFASELATKQDKAPTTDEMYFDITSDGVISLKSEYRGACPTASYPYGVSENGVGKAGSYNSELPEDIIIPEEVNGIAVTALAEGMFVANLAVKSITIPAHITEIPKAFAASAMNLHAINGTENVKVLNSSVFGQTLIEKANFPNLEQINGKNNFMYCVNLVSADLGNNITALPERAFFYCEKLAALRNTKNVAEVGKKAFTGTKRLKILPFASKLTNVGDEAFSLCRADYDWDSLTGCTFGAYATPNQRYATDFWTGRTFTECCTPMRSTFSQADPRWGSDHVGDITDMIYADAGCMPTSAAMVWSAFENKDVASPKEFEEAVRAVNPDLMSLSPGWNENLQQWFEALGYTAVHKTAYTAENVQAMYDALADGALVVAIIDDGDNGDTGDHAVVFHGINADGEIRVVDPTSAEEMLGIYNAATYAMPIQSMASMYWGFLIVSKP